jgi:hypothetical protein
MSDGSLSPAEIKRMIDAAARRSARAAVKETLITLGIDASTSEAIRESQQDFAWVRRTRTLSNLKTTRWVIGGIAAFTALAGSAAAMLVDRFLGGQ